MNITLQISDAAYQRLLSSHARIRGSIGLVSPTEGNFNEHAPSRPTPGTRLLKLRHGHASVCPSHVRLTLRVGLDEADTLPAQVLEDESREAGAFVDRVCGAEL